MPLLDLATHSEPARVEEYTTRIKNPQVDIWDEELRADAAAAKRDALTGIAHSIFS